jgi:hypothetical protein
VIDISPTDILGGARIVKKAVGALNKDTGTQAQYQAFKQSSNDFEAAIKDLSRTCSPFDIASSDELCNTLDHLQKTIEQQEKRSLKYDATLGKRSSQNRTGGIKQKWRWIFQDDQDLRDSNARSTFAVYAAILQRLQ